MSLNSLSHLILQSASSGKLNEKKEISTLKGPGLAPKFLHAHRLTPDDDGIAEFFDEEIPLMDCKFSVLERWSCFALMTDDD